MSVYEAIQEMRELTKQNIPFSMKFITMNQTSQTSKGYRIVNKALLRTGLSKAKSNKHNSLISYVDLFDDSNKSFYIPLLIEFNNILIE